MNDYTHNSLRIALINSFDHAGGAESAVRMLRDGLRQRGHQVTLWVRRKARSDDPRGTRIIPATDDQLARARRFASKGFYGLGLEASRVFCESSVLEGVDVIHLHNAHGHYLDLMDLPRLASAAPLVWTFHDCHPITGGCAFPVECERWRDSCGSCPQVGHYPIVSRFDRTRRLLSLKRRVGRDLEATIVAPSAHLQRTVKQSQMFQQAEVLHIPYGVDTAIFRPPREQARRALGIDEGRPVVMIAAQGLDDPRKGMDFALTALRKIDVPGLLVLVAGSGEESVLSEALHRHEVRWLGFVDTRADMAEAFAASDLLLFTSLAENFPCVVMESMSCGTPVLSFDIDGVVEQIAPDRTGFLVARGQVDEMGERLDGLLRDRGLLHRVGAEARRHAEDHWRQDGFLDSHEQLYHQLSARRLAPLAR